MSDSWTTIRGPAVSSSLRARALKRNVILLTRHRWAVEGNPKLGDAYPEYVVRLPAGSTKYQCDCHDHYGGEYRRFCSHILAVVYHRMDNPGEDDSTEDPDRKEDASEEGVNTGRPGKVASATAGEMDGGSVLVKGRETSAEDRPALQPVTIINQTPQDLPSVRREPPLPEHFGSFRPHQPPAIEQIVNLFNAGYKTVILDAPTGTGKTLVAEAVRRLYQKTALYTCTTKTLQEQVLADFPYARVLKGRSNYPTHDNPTITAEVCNRRAARLPACPACPDWKKGISWEEQGDPSGDDGTDEISGLHCAFCHPVHLCSYEVAKQEAMTAPLAILNTAYLLTEANGPGRFSGQDLVILDEADMLESELMNHVEVSLSKRKRQRLYLGEPKFITKEESWIEWLEGKVVPAVAADLADIRSQIRSRGHLPTLVKAEKATKNLLARVNWLTKPTTEGDVNLSGWVLNRTADDALVFKPVRVADYAPELLWSHSRKFLVMSATVISSEQLAADLGLEDDEWTTVSIPSTFPYTNRPVVLEAVGRLSAKTKDVTYPAAAEKVLEIIRRHPDQRVLVHTVSYELNKIIWNALRKTDQRGRVQTYFRAADRGGALEAYLAMDNAVLLSPSFERGVDLPYDACRVIVVAKIPYPYLGDKQVNARTYGTRDGHLWYCLAPDTKVLRDDLVWVPVSKLQQGDGLFGFDEDGPYRRWKPSVVEAIGETVQPTYALHLEDGTTLICSAGHQWLTQAHGSLKQTQSSIRWRTAEQIANPPLNKHNPYRIMRVLDVWDQRMSWETGYLAGLLDGEGTLGQFSTSRRNHSLSVSFSQKPGQVSNRALLIAQDLGFNFASYDRINVSTDGTFSYDLRGGRTEVLKLLGQVRPIRLLDKFDIHKFNGHFTQKRMVAVDHVEYLGEQKLVGMQTSTHTFVAEGFASHNSVQTIRTLVQMTGRGMRSAEDWVISYILDESFHGLYGPYRRLFPSWWTEAVVWDRNNPKWRESVLAIV